MAFLTQSSTNALTRQSDTTLKYLTINFRGKSRRATLHGREHIVVPMTLIVPGVLNGSKGPLYYPREEIANNVAAWNGMPIVVYHPNTNGYNVSARDPQVSDKQQVGTVYNATTTNDGKLRAEGWFDVERTAAIDQRVLNALERGEPIELSTGLFTINDETPGSYQGREYVAIARNYNPDHLAVLPDQTGACSLKDGCGVLVNSAAKYTFNAEDCPKCGASMEGDPDSGVCNSCGYKWGTPTENAGHGKHGVPKSLNTGKFKKRGSGTGKGEVHEAAQTGAVMLNDYDRQLGEGVQDGVTPEWVIDATKWDRATNYARTSNGVFGPTAAHIYLGLGGQVANANNESTINQESDMQLSTAQRKTVIDGLIANSCGCWTEADRGVLEKRTDNQLQQLETNSAKVKKAEAVLNAVETSFPGATDAKDLPAFVANCGKTMNKGKTKNAAPPVVEEEEEEVVEEEEMEEEEVVVGNKTTKNKKATKNIDAGEDCSGDDQDDECRAAFAAMDGYTGNRRNTRKGMTEYLKQHGTAEDREVWQNALAINSAERSRLVGRLTVNLQGKAKEAATAIYNRMKLAELRVLTQGVAMPDAINNRIHQQLPNYSGASGGPVVNNEPTDNADDDVLDIPAMNFKSDDN